MKKKVVILSIILLSIVFIILLALFSIKFYKVNKIINLIRINSSKTNYSYFIKNSTDDILKISVKVNDGIVLKTILSDEDNYKYYDFNKNILYNFDNKNYEYHKTSLNAIDEDISKFPLYKFLTSDFSFGNKLKLVFEWKIRNYDENCYEITTKDNYKIIFDKTTGIALRATSLDVDEKFDRIVEDFKENSVTDEETKLPDLSDYSLWENN